MNKHIKKKKLAVKDGLFLLLGYFLFSLFFWFTGNSYSHVFGVILTALGCYILYKMERSTQSGKEWVKARDVLNMCVGIILSSFSHGFPFNSYY